MPAFSFLNSGFLWALPLASIPVLIHLLSRRRLPEVSFPTTQFLRELEPREIRRLRLREILLLILRTLAIILLVLAFARPSITPRNAVTTAAAAMAVLIDDSESMGGLDEQAKPRMEGAIARARAIVAAARPGDEVTLISSTRPVGAGTEHTSDRVRLGRSLTATEVTMLPADMPGALLAGRRALERSRLKDRELYLISDLQRSNFDPKARAELAEAMAAGIRVYLVPLVQSRVPNHALVDVDPVLRPGPMGRGLELRSRLANYADGPSDRIAIRVRHGDALVGGGDVTLKADENRWAPMPLDWRGAGSDSAQSSASVLIEADQDALAADDHWYAVLGAPGRLRVLRITEPREGASAPRFSSLALDPGRDGRGGFVVDEATPSGLLGLTRSRYDVLLLEDVASLSVEGEARVRTFVRDGGGLVVALGPHADPGYYGSRLFPGIIDLALDGPEQASAGGSYQLRARLPGHDVLNGLNVAVGAPLSESRLTGLMKGRTLTTRPEVVVQTTGGLPLVATSPGVAVYLSSLSDDWGDLPYSGAFVPLVRGLVSYAAQAQAGGPGSIRVGEAPSARLSSPPGAAVIVRGPESYTSQATVRSEGTGYQAQADAPAIHPGFYEFESGGRSLATVAVNVSPIESDLAPIAPDSLRSSRGARASTLGSANALASHLRDTRRGRELWMTFLLLAAAALVGELLLGSARALRA
jgi:aerotolerance regulator-like protein/VWA domain-containing protein